MAAKKTKAITKYSKDRLTKNANVGMSKVDPIDIKPPRILLMQKLSALSEFTDHMGKHPKVGQFFHTGKLRILETVKCNFLFAAKGTYIDRRAKPEEEKDQYQTLAVMQEDQSLFAMTFRSSAINALSQLFGVAASQKIPMYCLNVEIETKELTGKKGTWLVPVVRIRNVEKNDERLIFLEDYALKFDKVAEKLAKKDFTKNEGGDGESPVTAKDVEDIDVPF